MAISEDMKALVDTFGEEKFKHGQNSVRNTNPDAWPGAKESKAALEKLSDEIEELELKARHWDEHRCY